MLQSDFFQSIKTFFRPLYCYFFFYRLPLLSGVIGATSYIPSLPWGFLFCFVPLWIFWFREKSLRRVFMGGWWTQFIFSVGGFSWLPNTLQKFGQIPFVLAFIGFLIFASLFHLYIPLSGWIWAYIRRKTHTRVSHHMAYIFLLPAFLSLSHLLFPSLFPWNYATPWLWVHFPISQLADLIGFQGLSVMTLFFNLFFFFMWKNGVSRFSFLLGCFALILFGYLNYWGWSREKSLDPPESTAHILIVQGNIGGHVRKYGPQYQDYALYRYLELTQEALDHHAESQIDFIVWPEVAVIDVLSSVSREGERGWRYRKGKHKRERETDSYFSYPESERVKKLRAFLRRNQMALITGAYSKKRFSGLFANAFFLIGKEGENEDTPYYKTHLLAFGEYLPGSRWFPFLKKWLPQVGDLLPGSGPEMKVLNGFKIGPQICYESLFPYFTKELSDQGSQLIVNLTNDSWYGVYQQPYQHLYLAAERAIEFRRPFIRATNTGVSGVILANGDSLAFSSLSEKWWHLYHVPYYKNPKTTLYQKYPHFILLSLLLLTSFLFLFLFFDLSRSQRIGRKEIKERPMEKKQEERKEKKQESTKERED